MSMYVASHYKNQPNDLQLLSDAPAHQLFVLLGPQAEGQGNAGQLPDVLCVVQVALEGAISRESVNAQLRKGERASGDMIPWTVAQQFQDAEFAGLSGARIVRIATHPDVSGMGYGTRAIELLSQYYQGEIINVEEGDDEASSADEDQEDKESKKETTLQSEKVKPRKKLEPLLLPLAERKAERLHWFGTSFGITQSLYNFWHKNGFRSVYVRQTANPLTGEHSAILLKGLKCQDLTASPTDGWLSEFLIDAKRRFISLLSFEFRHLSIGLVMSVLFDASKLTNCLRSKTGEIGAEELTSSLTPYDMKRLESYAKNMVDYHMIVDLLPGLARLYFLQRLPALELSYLQRAIILGIGLQHKSVDELQMELNIPSNQLLALFNKAIRKFNAQFRLIMEKQVEDEMKPSLAKIEEAENTSATMQPTRQTLDQELEEGKKVALQKLKQQSVVDSVNWSEYAIEGTDQEFEAAIGSKGLEAVQNGAPVPLKVKKTAKIKRDSNLKDNGKRAKKSKKYKNVN